MAGVSLRTNALFKFNNKKKIYIYLFISIYFIDDSAKGHIDTHTLHGYDKKPLTSQVDRERSLS